MSFVRSSALVGLIVLASAASAAPSLAAPRGISKSAVVPAKRLQLGLRLAKVAQPEQVVVPGTVNAFEVAFTGILKKDGSGEALEAKFPGFTSTFLSRAKPIVEASVRRRLPSLWQRMAAVYARELTVPQLNYAIAFFESPAGRKFVAQMNQKIDPVTFVQELEAGNGKISDSGYASATKRASTGAVEGMTPDEIVQVEKFSLGEYGPSLRRVAPMVMEVARTWVNESDPEANRQVQQMRLEVLEEIASRPTVDKQ